MKNFLKSHTLLLALCLCLLTILGLCTLEKRSCLKVIIYEKIQFIIGFCPDSLIPSCQTTNSLQKLDSFKAF